MQLKGRDGERTERPLLISVLGGRLND